MNTTKINYESLKDSINLYEILISPSELHGFLCGVICTGKRVSIDIALISSFIEGKGKNSKNYEKMIIFVEKKIIETLHSDDMDFKPIISSEKMPIDIRVNDLSLWCSSYIYGLGVGEVDLNNLVDSASSNIEEIIKDIVEISKASMSETELHHTRDAGFDFEEIFEYVRVSVQILFESFN
jgi:hypothetical protein|tara:strand:- start:24 stop:566 length:543 start_codon:yes stop_codon:yes gene_type:complete